MPAHTIERIQLVCAYPSCGKAFTPLPSAAKRGAKYCSHLCSQLASRHRRVEYTSITCAYEACGKTFEVPPSRLQEARFCSRLCQTRAISSLRWPETLAERFWRKVAKTTPDQCWLWQGTVLNSGYGQCQIHKHGKLLASTAHVVSWFLHTHTWPPSGLMVLHNCPSGDNPLCVNPAHLWLGTQKDNMQDCVRKGRNGNVTHPERLARGDRNGLRVHRDRAARGERNVNCKISDAEWAEALALWDSGEWTQTALAQRYGVRQSSIGRRLKHRYHP